MPFLSFFLEARIGREVREYLAKREADAAATRDSSDSEPVEAAQ